MNIKQSSLRYNPKSRVMQAGYINIYSNLNPKELKSTKYKTRYKVENDNWDETQVYLSKRFKDLSNNDSVVLDAGCGHGNYVIDENREKITWAVGVDINHKFVTNNVCIDDIQISKLEKLSFEANIFDMCISLWVLEHIDKPELVFPEIYRVLKPGGYFLFATPNKHFLPLKLIDLIKSKKVNHFINKSLFGRESKDIFDTHYKANDIQDIQELCEEGFEIVELFYNYDPSYFALNDILYTAGNINHKVSKLLGLNWLDPHIIGILKKPYSSNINSM